METQPPPTEQMDVKSQWDDAVRQFAKRGLALCLLLFIVEVGLLFLVSSAPFFPGEQTFYVGQAKSLGNLVQNSTTPQLALEIFMNNYRIALEEMIPGFGAVLFAISLYVTARVTEAIALDDGLPVLAVVVTLFILPHSWIELPAYAVATAEGVFLLIGIIRAIGGQKGRLSMEAWQLGINLIIVTVMLAVAAVFESVEIALESFGVVYALLTWIPFAAIVVGVVILNRRLSRIKREVTAASTSV